MIVKATRVEIRDEGTVQGRARAIDFTGSSVSAAVSGDVATITDSGGAGGGGFILLNTYTPSSASSVDFTSQISATYARYMATFHLRVSADGAAIWIRTDTSNGASFDSAASNYSYTLNVMTTSGITSSGSTGDTKVVIADSVGNATNEGTAGMIFLPFLGSASMYPVFLFHCGNLSTTTTSVMTYGTAHRRSAAAIDSFQLLPSTGNFTGTVHLYGIEGT